MSKVWVVDADGNTVQIDRPNTDDEARPYLPDTHDANRAYWDCRESGMDPFDSLCQGTLHAGDDDWEDNAY